MSNFKSMLFFALGALALVGVHVALSYCGVRDAQIVRRTTLVDPTFRVTSLSVSRKGEPVTRLQRLPTWRLVAPFSGSVDEQVVMRMLDALTFAPLEDMVTVL